MVWYEAAYDIYGQLVNQDGSLFNTASNVNFAISEAGTQYAHSVAYDSANQRFLVVWNDDRSGGIYHIYGQLVNPSGSLSGANFALSDAAGGQFSPSVAYNSRCGNFLTAYVDYASGAPDIGSTVVGQPCCAPPPSGMVAWWGGDNNALDMVGTNHGTLQGGATYAPGMVGQAFSFNGALETYVEVPNTAVFNPAGAFSVDGWFYIDPAANQWKISTFVAKSEGSSGNGWALYYDDRSWTHDLKFIVGSNAVMTNAIPTPGWYHVAGVFDPAVTPRTRLYLNGVQVADSGSQTGGPASNTYNVRIGAMNWGDDRLNGKADEVEFFNRALTPEEIAAIYNAGSAGKCRSCTPPPSNMLSWWRAEDTADDATGANNGTLMNGAAFAAGRVGQAFSFDGIDDYLRIPDSLLFNLSALTFETWFKTTSGGVILGYQHEDALIPSTNHVPVLYVGTDNKLYAELWAGYGLEIVSGQTVNDGNWHHAVLTYDGSTMGLYLDGILMGSLIGTISHVDMIKNQIGTGNTLGWPAGNGDWFSFNGLIDEVGIYNRGLSAEEIAAIYNSGSTGKCFVSHNVTSSAPGGNGSLSCTGPVLNGYDSTCTITPATGYYLSGLTDNGSDVMGSVSGGTYTISNVTGTHDVVATFAEYPVRRFNGSPTGYYMTIQNAYNNAVEGEEIRARDTVFTGDLTLDLGIGVTLRGGYVSGFATNTGVTTVAGSVTFSGGIVAVEGIVVQ